MDDFNFVQVETAKKSKPAQLASPISDEMSLKDLNEAISRLNQGQPKAAIRAAADAVNRMAKEHGVHGWAGY